MFAAVLPVSLTGLLPCFHSQFFRLCVAYVYTFSYPWLMKTISCKAELKSPNKADLYFQCLSQLLPQVIFSICTDRDPFCSLLVHSTMTPFDLSWHLTTLVLTAPALMCHWPSLGIVSNITLVKIIQAVCLCDQRKHLACICCTLS